VFARYRPVNKDRLPTDRVPSGDVEPGLFELTRVGVHPIPCWDSLLGDCKEAALGLVVWSMPVPQAVVPVIPRTSAAALSGMPSPGVERFTA
jgi:hypothetical protein